VSWTAIACCLVAACGGSDLVLPSSSLPAVIRVVDGDGQSGSVGQLLPAPIVVEVTDSRCKEVEGIAVEFALTSAGAGAEIVPATATTDAKGQAQARVLLGSKVGVQTGEARVTLGGGTAPKATFSAQAVSQGPSNGGPRASFNWHCEALACQFIDASTDSDGTLTGWTWGFGDGVTSTERQPAHSYSKGGTFTVTLSVTDNHGSSHQSSTQVTVTAPSSPPPPPPANKPPQADFGVACRDLTCTFTDRSKDDDGRIASWRWSFGDGRTSSERSPSHSYGTPGRYTVVLTVTDNGGAGDSQTHEAEPSAPPPPPPPPANKPPQADFDVHCKHSTCTFADMSKDEDGTIVGWHWSFGDGLESNERNPVHTYADPGHYDVSLSVTDNDGATNTKTRRADAKE